MALPANVSFGTVTGRFLTATADSPVDQDRDPEGTAATDLSIVFAPNLSPAVVRDASAVPPTVFALAPVTATVGASGDLLGPDGQAGIRLVATTGTTIDPSGWTWKVTLASPSFPTLSFSFGLDPGQAVDLASVVQVPASPGATLDAWLQAVTDAQAARDAAQAAAASVPLALLPLQTSLPTATVAVTANANVDTLWPGWYNPGQSVYTDISAITDPAVFGPYFYGGQPYRDTWWGGGAAIYNRLNSGTNSTWALAVRITGSTRLLVGMNGAVGSLTASQFVIEVDGQKISRRYVDTGIVYDGHQTGLLLTFPDTRGHDIRIWSKAGFKLVVVDAGGTVTPTPAPFGGKKRLVIAGDSWTEGTAQAGPAVSLAAMLQLAADWDVAYLGNGGTGYVATGPSYASAFGSSQRLTAMESFTPDLWVFLGSINDGENAASAVQTAAAAAYSALGTALPNAKGLVIGPQLPGHPLVSAALAAAAGAASNVLAYIDPAAQGWAAPAGVTGPTDGSHPSVIGTEHLAAHLIATVRAVTVAAGDMSW